MLLPAPAAEDAGEASPSPPPPGALAEEPPCGVLSAEPLGLVPLVPGPLVPGADVPLLLDSPASNLRADLRLPSHMYSTARAQQPGSATTPNRLGGQGQERDCGQGEHTTTQNMDQLSFEGGMRSQDPATGKACIYGASLGSGVAALRWEHAQVWLRW